MTRVLVIDDCEEVCEVVREILRDEGFEVSIAADSRSGIAELEKSHFDAVLCDLVLPLAGDEEDSGDSAMVGVHCINEIAQRHPAVPVIAISGELVGSPLGAVQRFGARATLSKPFGRDELLSALKVALAEPPSSGLH